MTPKKINIADLPEFDMAEHLDSDQAIAEYLSIVLEENYPAEVAHALGWLARAKGMTEDAGDANKISLQKKRQINAGSGTRRALDILGINFHGFF